MKIVGFIIGVALVGLAGAGYIIVIQSMYEHGHNQELERISVHAPQQLKTTQSHAPPPEQQIRALSAGVAPSDQAEQSPAGRVRLNQDVEPQVVVGEVSGESSPLPLPQQLAGGITIAERDRLLPDVRIKTSPPELIDPTDDAHTAKTEAAAGIEGQTFSFDNYDVQPVSSMGSSPLGLYSTGQERESQVDQSQTGMQAPTPGRSWQVIWKPFHRRFSANGFAQRLREMTGLPIEVREQTRGEYVIAFSYADESERLHNIELIERLTGLKLVIGGYE